MFAIRNVRLAAIAMVLACAGHPAVSWGQAAGTATEEEETTLIAVLQSDSPTLEKANACQRLAVIGTERAVPALAALLSDPQLAHYARFGLEPIPHASVDATLREALGKLDGLLLIGVVDSLGQRRDGKAVAQLKPLAVGKNAEVAAAALAALGRIATTEAVETFRDRLAAPGVSPALAEASLTCGETLISDGRDQAAVAIYDALRKSDAPARLRAAATLGAILARKTGGIILLVQELKNEDEQIFVAAAGAARELQNPNLTQSLVPVLGQLPAARRAKLLLVLGDVGSRAALPAIRRSLKDESPAVQRAAVQSLAGLGDEADVPNLLELAAAEDEQLAATAQHALVVLPGAGTDAALVAALQRAHGAARLAAVEVIGKRRVAAAVPLLVKAVGDSDESLRLAAIRALGETISLEEFPALVARIASPASSEEKLAAEEALKNACVRMPDQDACAEQLVTDLSQAPLPARQFMIDLLGFVGGPTALEAVAASARDENTEIQDAATRVLGQWMNADAAPKLLELAKSLENDRFRFRALRGYIRIARQFNMSENERAAMCRAALSVAERDDERKEVLKALIANPSAATLEVATSQLDSRTLREQAATTAIGIARQIVEQNPQAVTAAMRKVADARISQPFSRQASDLINRAGK